MTAREEFRNAFLTKLASEGITPGEFGRLARSADELTKRSSVLGLGLTAALPLLLLATLSHYTGSGLGNTTAEILNSPGTGESDIDFNSLDLADRYRASAENLRRRMAARAAATPAAVQPVDALRR